MLDKEAIWFQFPCRDIFGKCMYIFSSFFQVYLFLLIFSQNPPRREEARGDEGGGGQGGREEGGWKGRGGRFQGGDVRAEPIYLYPLETNRFFLQFYRLTSRLANHKLTIEWTGHQSVIPDMWHLTSHTWHFCPGATICMRQEIQCVPHTPHSLMILANSRLCSSSRNIVIFYFSKTSQFSTHLKLNGKKIENVNQIKLLGTIVTDDLKWGKKTLNS